jgi:hypothetical protein
VGRSIVRNVLRFAIGSSVPRGQELIARGCGLCCRQKPADGRDCKLGIDPMLDRDRGRPNERGDLSQRFAAYGLESNKNHVDHRECVARHLRPGCKYEFGRSGGHAAFDRDKPDDSRAGRSQRGLCGDRKQYHLRDRCIIRGGPEKPQLRTSSGRGSYGRFLQ